MKVVKSVVASTHHPAYPPTVSIMRCVGPSADTPNRRDHFELWVQLDEHDPTTLIDEDGEDQVLLPVSLSREELTILRDAATTALASHPPS